MPVRKGYWIYEWEEECSSLTPGAHWVGLDYRAITCRMWIPNSITSEEDVDAYVEAHAGDPDAYVKEDECLTCGVKFSDAQPHWAGGVCRSCWATSH